MRAESVGQICLRTGDPGTRLGLVYEIFPKVLSRAGSDGPFLSAEMRTGGRSGEVKQ